jgi:hypothetical protein
MLNVILTLDDSLFINVFNDQERFPKIEDVANHLGIAKKTVSNRASKLRTRRNNGENVPELTRISGNRKTPISEDSQKYKHKHTKEECIKELLRIVNQHPDNVISRNFFRVHSNISESTWNRYFGTFDEFKRQSGVKLSRSQHKLEREIAKHASVKHYSDISQERMNYGSTYDMGNGKSFKTVLIASDLHDKEIDPFFLRVFLDTAERVQPDIIVLGGDVFDLPEFGVYTVDPREWDVVGRIKFVHENILRPLREKCPNTQIDFIEGNHEARLLRHLADKTPALRAVLSDLHGFTVGSLLGLDEFEVNYIAKSDLATFTKREHEKELAKNYKIYWDCLLVHHFPHAKNMSIPGVNGHSHKHVVWSEYSPLYGSYEWMQIGSGHRRDATFCEAEKWNMGFVIANLHVPSRSVNFDYITISDFAVSGGMWYYRNEDEAVPNDRIT